MSTGLGVLFVAAAVAILAAARGSGASDTVNGSISNIAGAGVSTLVALIGEAIATAEGFYKSGSVAHRQNNPGNLTDAAGQIRNFPTVTDGWNALYDQIRLMFNGSQRYSSGMSLAEIGNIYANGDPNWAMNVAAYIGVPVSTTLDELSAQYG